MSDSSQNPPPDESGDRPPEPAPGEPTTPPDQGYGATPPPPPPPGQGQGQGQGSYGTTPPPPGQGGYGTTPPPGGWQQPGPMPPPTQQAPTGGIGQPADLLPRFVARLIDFILLGFTEAIVAGIIVAALVAGSNVGAMTGFGMNTGAGYAANAISSVIGAAIALAYFTLMEAKRGQTVGKMVMRLETRGPAGGHPTMEQALRRNAFTAIGIIGAIPFLGWVSSLLSLAAVITIAVTISNDRVARHGWHDNFAGGTTVYRIG